MLWKKCNSPLWWRLQGVCLFRFSRVHLSQPPLYSHYFPSPPLPLPLPLYTIVRSKVERYNKVTSYTDFFGLSRTPLDMLFFIKAATITNGPKNIELRPLSDMLLHVFVVKSRFPSSSGRKGNDCLIRRRHSCLRVSSGLDRNNLLK